MKMFIVMISIFSLFGCKQDHKEKEKTVVVPPHEVYKKLDTPVVVQDIWFDGGDGKYHLQTYVKTHEGQMHPRKNSWYGISGTEGEVSPYIEEIFGTMEEIKSKKQVEFSKAQQAFLLDAKQKKEVDSNLQILRSLKVE